MSKFQPMTLQELLALPPETREQSYRRGYRDGYVAALQAVYGNRGIPPHLWAFWQGTLLEWQKAGETKVELPPVAPGKASNAH